MTVGQGKFHGLAGSSSNDTLTGNDSDNELRGRAGDDTLIAGDGDDRLAGEAGNDTLDGGLGNDTYYYYGKPGFDIIQDAGGSDRIVFAEGYYAASGWGSPYRQGNDLVYVSADGQSGFTVKDHFSDPNKSIEYFEFERSGYTTQVRNSDLPIGNSEYDEIIVGTPR